MNKKTHTIIVECPSCGGSGLYRGFCEGPGEAVVCGTCGGQGWCEYRYKEFKKRRKLVGIDRIYSRTLQLKMTYAEFEKKFKEESPWAKK